MRGSSSESSKRPMTAALVADDTVGWSAPEPDHRDRVIAKRVSGEGYRAPSFVDGDDERDRLRWLGRLVAVGARDVRVHLERVNRWVALGDADGAYGALVDLFIVMGTGAREVRRRCLFWARDVLRPHQRATLEAALFGQLEPTTPIPYSPHSVLSLGITSSAPLVADAPASPAGADDEASVAPQAAVTVDRAAAGDVSCRHAADDPLPHRTPAASAATATPVPTAPGTPANVDVERTGVPGRAVRAGIGTASRAVLRRLRERRPMIPAPTIDPELP